MLLHADNFNYYGASAALMLEGIYASVANVTITSDPDGLSAGKVIQHTSTAGISGLRYVLPAASAKVGIAMRVWLSGIPVDSNSRPTLISWKDELNNQIAILRVNPTGGLDFVNATGTTSATNATAATSGPVITAAGWYHIEACLTCGTAANAELECRVEGVTVLTYSGFTTSKATCSQVNSLSHEVGSTNSTTWYQKDYVVWDGSGTENNDFLGSVLIYELLPTADAAFPSGWTSTAANGYSVLDNNPPVDASAYISADNSPPAAAVFELTNLPADVSSVRGIITRVRAAKSDGGDGSLQVSLRSGVNDDAGTDRSITTTPTFWSDVSELDPATGAAWLPGAVDDAQLVLERTT